jgi:peptidoglycan/xylan/chitin deacetylase (PgdA/CDA1 family)
VYLVYFHNVLADASDAFDRETPRLSVTEFERQLDGISQRYPIIGFEQCLERINAGEVDEEVVALCFDDGHLGIHRYAYPCLSARNLTAGIFIVDSSGTPTPTDPLLHFEELEIAFRLTASTRLERHDVEMATEQERAYVFQGARQRLKALPDELRRQRQASLIDDLAVDRDTIAAYANGDERFAKIGPAEQHELSSAGWVFGGHTRSHRVLSRLSDAEIDHEVSMPARVREQRSQFRPFAYPYGATDHCDDRVAERVRAAGYDCAFTTTPGPLLTASLESRHLLPRFSVRELMSLDA